uniref:Secreted protein n=1 Tax=Globodera pallida TaxID=36090 RepID=A0A183C0H2_GLOPA
MKIIVLTIFCVAPWVCFGLNCKNAEKGPNYGHSQIVECYTDKHYCAAANCTAFNTFTKSKTFHSTKWGCFNSTDSQKCSEFFTPTSNGNQSYTCEPCLIGEKDVDLSNDNFTGVITRAVITPTTFAGNGLKCKSGELSVGSLMDHDFWEIVECSADEHYCVAASCAYVNIGLWPDIQRPDIVKVTANVTKWGCSESNEAECGMQPSIADVGFVCDPCLIGQKDVDLANENYTGVFPVAAAIELTGTRPSPSTTPPKITDRNGDKLSSTVTSTKNGATNVNNSVIFVAVMLSLVLRAIFAIFE